MAGDFYLAQSDYLKAKELYEYALRIIAEVKELMPPEGKGDTIIRRNFAKFRYIEIITKIAKIYEAENRLEDAEAKYSEADKLIAESGLGLPIVKYLFTLADFYQRAKKEERAKELYKKAENILRSYPPFYDERLVLNVRLQKGLGYINRNDIKVAAEYYSTALKELREIKPYFGTSKIQLQNDYPPYTKNHHLTSEFYTDEAEILESLASLSETANAATLKAEAQKARELAKEATAQEEKPSCRQ
jgi:tetratricopeptide (TPR) repeat protein